MAKGRKTEARGVQPSTVVAVVALLVAVGAVVLLLRGGPDAGDARVFTPVSAFGDVHGLAVDPEDPARLFVATHHGLVRGVDGTDWVRVGAAQDDYMGFSMHPTDGDTFWVSGHPRRGGNLGVQQSTDGGHTWRVLALAGQVDFHAMTVSPADPARLWGVFRGELYRSADGGHAWTVVGARPPHLFALAADPKDRDTLWGAGPAGIAKSADGGATWSTVTAAPFQGIALARDGVTLYAVGQAGSARSTDAGVTWTPLALEAQGTPAHVAVDPTDARVVYVATYQGAIHASRDGGATWRLLKGAA